MISRRHLVSAAASGSMLLAAGCTAATHPPTESEDLQEPAIRVDPHRHEVLTRAPQTHLVTAAGPEGAWAASRAVLAATAVVVLAPAAGSDTSATPAPDASPTPPEAALADPAEVAAIAQALGLPLFVDAPELAGELDRLQTRTVIAYGTPRHAGDREIIPGPAAAEQITLDGLPARAAAPSVLALTADDLDPTTATVLAAAGLRAERLIGPHPGVTAESTARVKGHTGPVIGVGDGFGTSEQFAAQVEVTRTATELPGGGIAPFPGRHMIALYGHPQTASLGMLGEQPPAQAVDRLARLVADYAPLIPDIPVIGAFEIIATVATGAPTDEDDYSTETPIDELMPWIEAAEAHDMYVVLDLQPGRTSFLDQAKRYADLLLRPWVGLALDPEWRLKPDERHLRQIGQVHIDEVNEVGAWLADLVAEHALPPKVLTLHQFQTRMIVGRERLDTTRPEVQYLVHVDGQGPQGAKQGTWETIRRDLPTRTWLGWKNFEHEDTPMLTPQQTVSRVQPLPQFISYQ